MFRSGIVLRRTIIYLSSKVGFGMTDLLGEEKGAFWLPANSFKIYEGYDRQTLQGDLAVIILAKDINFNEFVSPICLPEADLSPMEGDKITGIKNSSFSSMPLVSIFKKMYLAFICK